MRVLLVSSGSGSRGGGEIFLYYLGKGLSDRGHDIISWIPSHPRMDELAEKCEQVGSVFRASYRNTYDYSTRSLATCFNSAESLRIAHEWNSLEPDIVHINKQNLEDGLDLLRAAKMSICPSVCTIHLTQTARYLRAKGAWLRDWIARSELRKYQGSFVAVQDQRRDMLAKFLGGDVRTKTIFNGVPGADPMELASLREAKRRDLGLVDSNLLVVGVGRLVEQKRPFHFLEIAQELHRQIAGIRFLWVGDGPLRVQWREAILKKDLEGIVTLVGWQSDVLPYLAAGDLLLHVAKFEGLPFGVIEAMAAGLPCALTRDLASEVPFIDGKNVIFFNDVVDLVKRLNPHSLASIAEGGLHLIKDHLSLGKMAKCYEDLYVDTIVKDKGRSE